jgi:hypothetical protein
MDASRLVRDNVAIQGKNTAMENVFAGLVLAEDTTRMKPQRVMRIGWQIENASLTL